jgi:hypothetical protein
MLSSAIFKLALVLEGLPRPLAFGALGRFVCQSASKIGSDALSMIVVDSLSADEPRLKEIEIGAPIHLAFNQLKFGDLSFHLTIGPG